MPYAQGQLVGWTNQIDGQALGRAWGAGGIKLEAEAYKVYPWVESEYLNLHGLNHKINFEVDARDAFSNVGLNRIGVQDDVDDNDYEYVRRFFALTNYAGGVLPGQYDPRFLMHPPGDLAGHRYDRPPGVDEHDPDGDPPAAPDQARPRVEAADHRLG